MMDFNDMLEEHIKSQADISIATLPVNAKDASEFGTKTNDENCIESFIEKPSNELLPDWKSDVDQMKAEGKYLASIGIYIFNKKKLLYSNV
jgi:glucose-1-phosphate adenylyltransferase